MKKRRNKAAGTKSASAKAPPKGRSNKLPTAPAPQSPIDSEADPAPVVKSTRLATTAWVRHLFIAGGWISLVVGLIGVVTPILPTTPFVLLSGYCFARGSERFHDWIMAHKYFGPMIRAFRDEKRIPLKAKLLATVMIIVTMTATALVVKKTFAIVAMATVGVAVVTYIWTFKN